ncbi:MAG: protein-L-isoaspartate(D-aspartate) O-methyltransferase [Deltaproteobacteria bacterium]|nr:protein-L-isoaspartate(D-aspartate) O-methyltransferase [Deltaproteobacteria bacterium]
MVARQLEARGVRDERVLAAMRRVPRHLFLPAGHEDEAYGDHPVPIGEGQTISQPFIVAEMTALALSATPPVRRALDVGTGSGYQAALLAEVGFDVVSIERLPSLAERARATLAAAGYGRVDVRVGDGTLGCPDAAPFCAIVVGAAAPEVPSALSEQLRIGGVLVLPVGTRSLQDMVVVRRTPHGLERETAGACVFVPLVGEQGWEK